MFVASQLATLFPRSDFCDTARPVRAPRIRRRSRQHAKDRPTEEATSDDIENSYPAVAPWVQGCGWIEIGDQEGLGFTVRALDLGGVVFEDANYRSLTEAMASLEFGLAAAMKELGIN